MNILRILEFSAIPNHARLRPRRQLSEARILLYVQLFYQIRQLDALLPQFRAGFLASYSAALRRLSDFLAFSEPVWASLTGTEGAFRNAIVPWPVVQ